MTQLQARKLAVASLIASENTANICECTINTFNRKFLTSLNPFDTLLPHPLGKVAVYARRTIFQ